MTSFVVHRSHLVWIDIMIPVRRNPFPAFSSLISCHLPMEPIDCRERALGHVVQLTVLQQVGRNEDSLKSAKAPI